MTGPGLPCTLRGKVLAVRSSPAPRPPFSPSETALSTTPCIAILGAGAVGGYIGGALQAATSLRVVLIGRPRFGEVFRGHGLTLTSLQGSRWQVPAARVDFSGDESRVAEADLVLVAVKSPATPEAAAAIARHARPEVPVVSLQNGVRNAPLLRAALPGRTVLAAMVPFNVVHLGQGQLHRATAGELAVQADDALQPWLPLFASAGLPLQRHAQIERVQWGKLLLNLNNAVNALADQPLATQLRQRDFRRVLAGAMTEGLRALRAAGIAPIGSGGPPPRALPALLRLPDALYTRLARRALAIDPQARSSMSDDLAAGRPTEVDLLNGEVVALARAHGLTAPINERLVALVHEAERASPRPRWSAGDLAKACLRA